MWRALWFALFAAALIAVACDSGRSETAPLVTLEPAFGGHIFDRPIEVGDAPVSAASDGRPVPRAA